MDNYSQLLDTMMDSIVSGDAALAPAFLRDKRDFPAVAQMGIYIEGYRLRLAEVVEGAYPALLHYLGRPAFTGLVNGFVAAYPSRHFNLDKYAIGFADYVSQGGEDAFACELALLEGAIHDVYQREETPAIEAGWAQRQTVATLASAPLSLRAASRLLAFTTPADDYLTACRAGGKPERPGKSETRLLVLRHKNQVRRLPLAHGEYTLLSLLEEGLTLAQALEDPRLAPDLERGDFSASLQGWLARWVAEGVLRQPS